MEWKKFLARFSAWQLGFIVYLICGLFFILVLNIFNIFFPQSSLVDLIIKFLLPSMQWTLSNLIKFSLALLILFGLVGIIMGFIMRRFYKKEKPQEFIGLLIASFFAVNLIIYFIAVFLSAVILGRILAESFY